MEVISNEQKMSTNGATDFTGLPRVTLHNSRIKQVNESRDDYRDA